MPHDDQRSTGPDLDRPDVGRISSWSALAVLFATFAAVSSITLLMMFADTAASDDDHRVRTRPYGPEDFPEMRWDEPLLPAVLDAADVESPAAFNVPPPPFSDETIFPCSGCHAELEVDPGPRELMFHDEIELRHGGEDRWCLDCHLAGDRDRLRLITGATVSFDESYRLCGQCHGTIYRDWREGIHGRRRGFWNGAKSYLLCAHCHDPHAPKFAAMRPLPPPIRPRDLRPAGSDEP